MFNKVFAFGTFCVLALSAAAETASRYTAEPLEPLYPESTITEIFSINQQALVCGQTNDALYRTRGFVWAEDQATDMGDFLESNTVLPREVNSLGQVCGFAFTPTGLARSFVWTAQEGYTDIGTLGGWRSFALDINDLGQVVGHSQNTSGQFVAYLWTQENGMEELGLFGGQAAFAQAINNNGDVALLVIVDGSRMAYLLEADGTILTIGDLGSAAQIAALNDRQQIVGRMGNSMSTRQAFIWDPVDGLQLLGTLGGVYSEAYDINSQGSVVGNSQTTEGEMLAFLWSPETGMETLPSVPDELDPAESAQAINDNGLVGGRARRDELEMIQAVVWTLPAPPEETDWLSTLLDDIIHLEANRSVKKHLKKFVRRAIFFRDNDRICLARRQLLSLMHQVSVIPDRKLSTEQKDALAQVAQQALDDLNEMLGDDRCRHAKKHKFHHRHRH